MNKARLFALIVVRFFRGSGVAACAAGIAMFALSLFSPEPDIGFVLGILLTLAGAMMLSIGVDDE